MKFYNFHQFFIIFMIVFFVLHKFHSFFPTSTWSSVFSHAYNLFVNIYSIFRKTSKIGPVNSQWRRLRWLLCPHWNHIRRQSNLQNKIFKQFSRRDNFRMAQFGTRILRRERIWYKFEHHQIQGQNNSFCNFPKWRLLPQKADYWYE